MHHITVYIEFDISVDAMRSHTSKQCLYDSAEEADAFMIELQLSS